jgi:riboflavin kinase/FMN adenylyltransferase
MEIILGLMELKRTLVNPVVTLGNFDGVHLGHQMIFEKVKEEASKVQGEAVVITFEPHPLKVLSPSRCPPLLTPFRKKMILIEKSGMDTVVCLPFTRTFAELPAFEFVRGVLVDKVKARKVVVGYNYHFGKGKEGNVETLKRVGKTLDVEIEVIGPLTIGGVLVSSSKIRDLIREGNVEEASNLLGRDYLILGRVIEGARRGHTLGFPTANLEISEELYPKPGIYAAGVVWNHQSFDGVVNVGWNPTFQPRQEKPGRISVEVHILNFNQQIYGDEIQVSFKKRIRDEIRFDSPSQLITQIKKDVQWAREKVFGKTNPHP